MPSETSLLPDSQTAVRRLSVAGLVAAAGFLVCGFTLTGFFGRWHWLFEITSHFRAQYAVILLGAAALTFWKRRSVAASVFLMCGLLNGWLLSPFLLGSPARAATSSAPAIRLLCWNVNSANRQFAELDRLIRAHEPGVVVVLEVDPEWATFLQTALTNHPHRVIEPRDDNFGIALFSREPLLALRVQHFGPAGLPSITATLSAGDRQLTLLATHPLPPAGRLRSEFRDIQLLEITEWTRRQSNAVVVVGDLNITPWSPVFADFLESSGLRNSAEGRGLQGTWPAFFPPMLIPIDHFLHSEEVAVSRREIVAAKGSDHLPQVVEFGLR